MDDDLDKIKSEIEQLENEKSRRLYEALVSFENN